MNALEEAWGRYVAISEPGSRRLDFAFSIPDGHELDRYLDRARPRSVVEFGAGFSTWILARPGATWRHYLLEESEVWRERTFAFLDASGRPRPKLITSAFGGDAPVDPELFLVDSGPDEYARVLLMEKLRVLWPRVPCIVDDWQIFGSRSLPALGSVEPWPGRACLLRWHRR